MMNKGGIKLKTVAAVLQAPFSSRYGFAALVGVLAAGGGLGYWFREQLTSGYDTTEEAVVSTLGLGVVPAAAWLVALLLALAIRWSWLRRVNLWIGSLVYGVFILGVMSFFQPNDGALAPFTLNGDVSLGGKFGTAIAGPIVWQGALRVLAVFMVGAAIATPRLTLDLGALLGKLLIYVYVFTIVAAKGMVSALSRMYRLDSRSSHGMGDEPDRVTASEARTGAQKASPRPSPSQAPSTGKGRLGTGKLAVPPPSPVSMDEDVEPVGGREGWKDSASDSADEADSKEPQPAATGKYNKFWSDPTYEPKGRNGIIGVEDPSEGEVEGEKTLAGPLVDSMSASWQLPPLDKLEHAPEGGISEAEMAETAETIRRTLNEYGVEVEIGQIRPGPTVTMYGLEPGWVRKPKQVKVTDEHGQPKLDEAGRPIITRVETKTRVKVDSILSREKDLALALKTPSIRIETPVMGMSLVGIEVPNPNPNLVTLRSMMESEAFKKLRSSATLPIPLGKGSAGETVVVDLTKMPHVLVAGSTGSGKSVFINTIVSCLIKEKTPAEVRLLLVDPKRVELTPFNGIPHLLTPVVVETDQVVGLLKGLIREMLSRYRRLEEVGVRNIEAYNNKMPEKMPMLVVAVDELADLMMSASFDVEQSLCRLAQLGRATGIHLIVATQRPSVDVVTGLIKANFPSRVSFAVTSQIDSRTILDTAGADKLLGRGDMLYLAVDASRPERIQGDFISDREIESLVNFWRTTPWAPLPKVSLHTVGDGDADEDDNEFGDDRESRDELLDKAIELAHSYNKLSTSLLQRRLRIGYPRAARLMDQLEDEGIVSASEGSKSRDVIMS